MSPNSEAKSRKPQRESTNPGSYALFIKTGWILNPRVCRQIEIHPTWCAAHVLCVIHSPYIQTERQTSKHVNVPTHGIVNYFQMRLMLYTANWNNIIELTVFQNATHIHTFTSLATKLWVFNSIARKLLALENRLYFWCNSIVTTYICNYGFFNQNVWIHYHFYPPHLLTCFTKNNQCHGHKPTTRLVEI